MEGGIPLPKVPPSTPSGKSYNYSEVVTETASAVQAKIGTLKAVRRRLVMSQELGLFFKELEREGVGTRSLESKARKLVEEQVCKNLRRGQGNKVGTDSNNIVEGEGNKVEGSLGVQRDRKVVCDLLKTKIGILIREERGIRKEYFKEWTR